MIAAQMIFMEKIHTALLVTLNDNVVLEINIHKTLSALCQYVIANINAAMEICGGTTKTASAISQFIVVMEKHI